MRFVFKTMDYPILLNIEYDVHQQNGCDQFGDTIGHAIEFDDAFIIGIVSGAREMEIPLTLYIIT